MSKYYYLNEEYTPGRAATVGIITISFRILFHPTRAKEAVLSFPGVAPEKFPGMLQAT